MVNSRGTSAKTAPMCCSRGSLRKLRRYDEAGQIRRSDRATPHFPSKAEGRRRADVDPRHRPPAQRVVRKERGGDELSMCVVIAHIEETGRASPECRIIVLLRHMPKLHSTRGHPFFGRLFRLTDDRAKPARKQALASISLSASGRARSMRGAVWRSVGRTPMLLAFACTSG
jgi:hypothetical protein